MKRSCKWRAQTLFIFVLTIGGIIIARLFLLQIIGYNHYNDLAENQHQFSQKLFPQRGEIFIQDLKSKEYLPLAVNKEFQQVYAIPKLIPEEKREEIAEQLSSILEMDKEVILNRINKPDDPYEPLKHKLDKEKTEQIENLKIEGVKSAKESWRYYPAGSLASHLVGFVGLKDEQKIGQYGLEGYYENELKGQSGFLKGGKDTFGYWVPTAAQEIQPAQDGAKLILTIDRNIQFKAEKELEEVMKKWSADTGTIIVMEPKSGALRAMVNLPNFNPNEYSDIEDIDIFLNPSIQKIYEPGSVFKPITMAIGLNEHQITPETAYEDLGYVQIKNSVIRNANNRSYGRSTMTNVLENSINTGAVFVQQKINHEIFRRYVKDFGFDRPTGIDLTGEIGGDISNLSKNRDINFATASFGQGVAITPIELITALAAVANQGKAMRPFVVEKIIKPNNEEIIIEPQIVKEAISKETTEQLTRMMISTIENSYDRKAQVKGYDVAGKTGTAQVPDPDSGGYSDKTIHTFVGFAPAFDPKFIVLIKIDNPKGINFASDSITPVFRRLAEYMFNYFEIPPSE
ncbi:MAG: hypothetical protein A2815_01460 [Candidatus Portnoybacteria bacterium RIFCSPHIGHO2_01_FULL_40_12b]|uniref:Penicillin-binding protein transpeptidase domain-containing protein n=1 Tax=Candidatus Portnoybacteria bacterium RIFCSPHIGHO2_01_FULL_40_12b TaxID=1801994 RepID=A0A1G2FCI7_9BACT|nr:MAG: hypothetical protein A2815_01460 [Candidatus Portnoybacteria bacterium RIFCSPHIGHO2_01_FULL_40_12b]